MSARLITTGLYGDRSSTPRGDGLQRSRWCNDYNLSVPMLAPDDGMERREVARKAAQARWAKAKKK